MNLHVRRLVAGLAVTATAALPCLTIASSSDAMHVDRAERASAASGPSAKLSALVIRLQRAGKQGTGLARALERRGYDVVSSAARTQAPMARSSAADVNVQRPILLHDEGSKYQWIATYTWKNAAFSEDQSSSCVFYDRCELPGRDAFGISFNKVVNMTDYWATFGPREAGEGDRILNPWEANRWGVAYRKQDIVERRTSPDDLNMYFGNIVVAINGRPCGTTSAFAKYAHTWEDRDLAGVTIGNDVLTYTFNGTSDRWQEASQPGSNTKSC